MRKTNPLLEINDRVVCIIMTDETSVKYGDRGTVISKSKVFGNDQYGVLWDNGSRLQLLGDTDRWMLEEDFDELKSKKQKPINESGLDKIYKNRELFKIFNLGVLDKFLVKLKKSGIVNMIQSAPYLYMGRERIEHELKYSDKDNEYIDQVLDMADSVQAEMINGTIKYLEGKGIEPDLSNINRQLKRFSQHIVEVYISLR